MKLIALLLPLLLLVGCESITIDFGDERAVSQPVVSPNTCPFANVPGVDLPVAMRHTNYAGGSCLWAALQDILVWQHREQEATYCRQNFSGGAGVRDAALACDKMNLDYAYTTSGDIEFLEWASRTRRGAVVYWNGGSHAITFCGFVGGMAVVIDNNNTGREQSIPREKFLNEWRQAGGGAFSLPYAPLPPRPWI